MVKIVKKSVKALEELKLNHDLVDIWRIGNPNTKKFTWRQKTPFVQRRLNFWLVSDSLQDEIHSNNERTRRFLQRLYQGKTKQPSNESIFLKIKTY